MSAATPPGIVPFASLYLDVFLFLECVYVCVCMCICMHAHVLMPEVYEKMESSMPYSHFGSRIWIFCTYQGGR